MSNIKNRVLRKKIKSLKDIFFNSKKVVFAEEGIVAQKINPAVIKKENMLQIIPYKVLFGQTIVKETLNFKPHNQNFYHTVVLQCGIRDFFKEDGTERSIT